MAKSWEQFEFHRIRKVTRPSRIKKKVLSTNRNQSQHLIAERILHRWCGDKKRIRQIPDNIYYTGPCIWLEGWFKIYWPLPEGSVIARGTRAYYRVPRAVANVFWIQSRGPNTKGPYVCSVMFRVQFKKSQRSFWIVWDSIFARATLFLVWTVL